MIKDNYLDIDHHGNPYNLRHIFGSHDDSDYEYNIPREWYIQKLFNPSDVREPDDPELPFAKSLNTCLLLKTLSMHCLHVINTLSTIHMA